MNNFSSRSFLENAKSSVPWWTLFFVLATLSFAQRSGSLQPVQDEANLAELVGNIRCGDLTRQIAFLLLGLFAVISLLRRSDNHLRINGSLGWLILAFLLWAFLSIAWAEDPILTGKRLVILAVLCLIALELAIALSFRQLSAFAFFGSSVLLLIGVSSEIAFGTLHPLEPGYRFGGQMSPIYQAINCGLMILAGLVCARSAGRYRIVYTASTLVALFFMLLTKSRVPTAGLILAFIGYWTLVLPRRLKVAWLFVIPVTAILLYWSLGDNFFKYIRQGALLGREESTVANLTGRLPLWDELFSYISRRPLIGYGYEGFWTPAHVIEVSAVVGWDNDDSHNAFIDLMLGLGIPAAITFGVILLVGLKRLILEWRRSARVEHAFAVAILLMYSVDIWIVRIHLLPQFPTLVALVLLAKLGFTPQPIAEIARKPVVTLRARPGCGKPKGT